MDNCISGKEIILLGGTGSLGKTLTKLLIRDGHNPHGIRIFSRDEAKQWQMRDEIKAFQAKHGTDVPTAYIIGDVRCYDSLYRAFENVDMVINAAAMKQIPACEANPIEAVMTNVDGAQNVIKAALARNVKRIMHISTDKAVYPINLYGATKAVAEKLFIQANVYSGRKGVAFSCCRYGNVLGSRGSIVPLFKQQIAEGKPITLTHPLMTRFWISLPKVANFLLNRLCDMQGGEIFIPNMGALEMSEMLVHLLPGLNYPIEEIGVRKGEKMHECLIAEEETWTRNDSGYIISSKYTQIGACHSNSYQRTHIGKLTQAEMKDMLGERI